MHNLSLPESTLLQAVTNTQVSWEGRAELAGTPWSVAQAKSHLSLLGSLCQVIDGFFVKRTADIKESAAYLALLTRGLERLYQVSRCAFLALFPYLGRAFPKEVKVREIPISQAGPLRPRIGQGLARGVFPRALAWPQSLLSLGPHAMQSPLGNPRGPCIGVWALPKPSLLTPHLQ